MNKIVLVAILLAILALAAAFLDPAPTAAELNQALRRAAIYDCDVEKVKELVEKGADINQIGDEGFDALLINKAKIGEFKDASLFSLVAIRTNSFSGIRKRCGETARYLSSIGAADSGHYLYFCGYNHKYKTPLVFENEHMKITFEWYSFIGTMQGVIEKKTAEPIRIHSKTSVINGVERFSKWERTPDTRDEFMATAFIVARDWPLSFYLPRSLKIADRYREAPKIVDNKLKLVKEFALTYEYKGQTYQFKLPEIVEEIDMKDYKIMCGAPNVR